MPAKRAEARSRERSDRSKERSGTTGDALVAAPKIGKMGTKSGAEKAFQMLLLPAGTVPDRGIQPPGEAESFLEMVVATGGASHRRLGQTAAQHSFDARRIRQECAFRTQEAGDRGLPLPQVEEWIYAVVERHVPPMPTIDALVRVQPPHRAMSGEAHPHFEIAGMRQLGPVPANPLL